MILKNKFNFGDVVISKIDEVRERMIVVGFDVRPGGIVYICAIKSGEERRYLDLEIDLYKETDEMYDDNGVLTIPYMKRLGYEGFINLLSKYEKGYINQIIELLAKAEEYEMAEVTRRYLERERK